MSLPKLFFIFLLLLNELSCNSIIDLKEFEENKIISNYDNFRFKVNNLKTLILIAGNPNQSEEINIERNLIASNTYSKNRTIDDLKKFVCFYSYSNYIQECELILRFKNYKDGYFIVYNNANYYPLKKFEKSYYFSFSYSFFVKGTKTNLHFNSDILENDTLIDIYPGNCFTVTNITDNKTQILKITDNTILLKKGSKYQFDFENNIKDINLAIKKREILRYKKNDELKIQFNAIPFYVLVNMNDFIEENKTYIYLFNEKSPDFIIQTADLETDDIQWDSLKFSNDINFAPYKEVFELKDNKKNYTLFKIRLKQFTVSNFDDPFCIFKVFQEYYTNKDINPKIISSEALYLNTNKYSTSVTLYFSNITNLRTFRNNEPKNFIYKKGYSYFNFIILKSNMEYALNLALFYSTTGKETYAKIYTHEFSYRNNLKNYLTKEKNLLIFDITKKTTLSIINEYGSSDIYFIDTINYDTINDIYNNNIANLKQLNSTENILNINSPFCLYIALSGENFINILINFDDNFLIERNIPSKYLIENKEYKYSVEHDILISINNNFISNINIYKNGNLIKKLNKENPYIKLNSDYGDIIFTSEKNTLINFYYPLNYIYTYEKFIIFEYPKIKNDETMLVNITSSSPSSYHYIFNYGYDKYITIDVPSKNKCPKHFIIYDPYSKFNYIDENLKYYLIIFASTLNYEINFFKNYEKEKNKFYYKIKPQKDNGIFVKSDYKYQVLKCSNTKIDINIISNNDNKILEQNDSYVINFEPGSLLTFNSVSEFIFIETIENEYTDFKLKYFIPKIENNKIFILIYNPFLPDTNIYILLAEDKNKDDNLINRLDNECSLISLMENEENDFKDLNYELIIKSNENSKILYEEIDYSKFSSKYLLVKLFTCIEKINLCSFEKTQRIYLENIKKDENQETENEITKIIEFNEYIVTRKQFIFEYDYKNYLSDFDDILINIFFVYSEENLGELEVINPLFERFIFTIKANEVIYLKKDIHVNSNGKFYFIFKSRLGISFYIHNMLHLFSLNQKNNYLSKIQNNKVSNGGYQFFNLELESEKYIYITKSSKLTNIFFYSLENKISSILSSKYTKLSKGKYIIFIDYSQFNQQIFVNININHYILNLELNREIQCEGYYYSDKYDHYDYYNLAVFLDLSKYNKEVYLVTDSDKEGFFKCIYNSLSDSTMRGTEFSWNDRAKTYSYINKISSLTSYKCVYTYYGFEIPASRFELITEVYEINDSQNLTFIQNNTIAFQIKKKNYNQNYYYYHYIKSNLENLKRIDKAEMEFVDIILSRDPVYFKLKSNDINETDLIINIIESDKNIQIEPLINNEIFSRINYNENKNEIKYFINLSKNKILINHFDYEGNIKFFLSYDEINENNLELIVQNEGINMNLFELITKEKFEVANNKIFAMQIENNTYSELIMSPEIHSFILPDNGNSKFIIGNRRYLIINYLKILIEDNSDANIIITDIDDNYIYTINKTYPIFENKIYNIKTLYLISDKDTLLYIYHQIKNSAKNFVFPKNNENKILLVKSDCEENEMNYNFDSGFENYIPLNLTLKKLEATFLLVNTSSFKYNKIQTNADYFAYFECSTNLINNFSGIYENYVLHEGYNFIEKNKKININIKLDNLTNNIFYQFFECETGKDNQFFISIDQNEIQKIETSNSFINGENEISLYLNGNDSFFNYYKTNENLESYKKLSINKNINYQIVSISENQIKFELIPKFKKIDFEFYFILYIDEEKNMTKNPLRNKCYLNELIYPQNKLKNYRNIGNKNIFIKKINYSNGVLSENKFEIPNITNNTIIYSNVFGCGKIFDNVVEYTFYNEQKNIYIVPKEEDPDEPTDNTDEPKDNTDEPKDNTDEPKDTSSDSWKDTDNTDENKDKDLDGDKNTSLSASAIIGISVGGVVLILIVVFIIIRLRKKNSANSIELEANNTSMNLMSKID